MQTEKEVIFSVIFTEAFSAYFIEFMCKVFQNHPKYRIGIFQHWHFPPIFVILKVTSLVTLFDRKPSGFQKLAKIEYFWHF